MSGKDEPEVLLFVKTSVCIFTEYLLPTDNIKTRDPQ